MAIMFISEAFSSDPIVLRALYRNFDFVEKIGVDLNTKADIYEVKSEEVPSDGSIISPTFMFCKGIEPIIIDMGIPVKK